jgi:hypothetical protein
MASHHYLVEFPLIKAESQELIDAELQITSTPIGVEDINCNPKSLLCNRYRLENLMEPYRVPRNQVHSEILTLQSIQS